MIRTISDDAKHLLQGNDLGGYTVPTKGLYPYQWNWDSVFVALGFAKFDNDRAWKEIETLLDAQWDCGFVPHIVFRKEDPSYFPGPNIWQGRGPIPSSGISNPPVAATMVKKLFENDGNKVRLNAVFPKLLQWHRWFKEVRDYDNKGIVVSVHPWETGRDNSPEWDNPATRVDTRNVGEYERKDIKIVDADMRPHKEEYDRYLALVQYGLSTDWDHKRIAIEGPYRVVDVGMTMIMIRANRDLLAIARALGEFDAAKEIASWLEVSEVGVQWLWDPEIKNFCSRDTVTKEFSGLTTNASFLSFYAGVGTMEQRRCQIEHIEAISQNCEYLMPSIDPRHSSLDHLRYWRGPIWMVVNYMICVGLTDCGYDDWADRVRSDSCELIQKSGFYESFSPMTGEGTGGKDFSWTAAIWLALFDDSKTKERSQRYA